MDLSCVRSEWRIATLSVGLCLAGCPAKKGEPPPPASSTVVPQAPPNAVGAMAAGKAPAPSLVAPTDPDSEEPEPPGTPHLGTPASPPDAGVSL